MDKVLRLLSTLALKGAVERLAGRYQAATGTKLDADFAPTVGLREGEGADVLVHHGLAQGPPTRTRPRRWSNWASPMAPAPASPGMKTLRENCSSGRRKRNPRGVTNLAALGGTATTTDPARTRAIGQGRRDQCGSAISARVDAL